MQSFQGEGSSSSKVATLMTLCVLARRIVFCPPAGWGGGLSAWESCLDGGMPSAGRGAFVVVLEVGRIDMGGRYRRGKWHQTEAQNLGIATAWGCDSDD